MTALPTSAALPLTSVTVSGSPSGSESTPEPVSSVIALPLRGVSSSVVYPFGVASGESLTPLIVSETSAESVPPLPSEIVYVNASPAVWPTDRALNVADVRGSYAKLPSLWTVTVAPEASVTALPTSAALPLTSTTVRSSPSGSESTPEPVSSVTTLPLRGVSSSVV